MARQFARGPRRKTQWDGMANVAGDADTLPTQVALVAGTPAIISTGLASGFLEEEVTFIRTIGSLLVGINTNTALGSSTVAVGLAIVRSEAAVHPHDRIYWR